MVLLIAYEYLSILRNRSRWERPLRLLRTPRRYHPRRVCKQNRSSILEHLRAREDQLLHTYEWVDPNAGIVRIPIDRAMELISAEGIASAAASDGRKNARGEAGEELIETEESLDLGENREMTMGQLRSYSKALLRFGLALPTAGMLTAAQALSNRLPSRAARNLKPMQSVALASGDRSKVESTDSARSYFSR